MNFSILIAFITCASFALGIQILNDKDEKYCFNFTWPGALIDNEAKAEEITNCTVKEEMKIPCVGKYIIGTSPPDLKKIWSNTETRHDFTCILTRGYSCIRYTYKFDEAITNATYFCGKMIQNKETAIQEACFTQKKGGYEVETCACQSTGFGDGMPCSSSTKLVYSFMVLVSVSMVLSMI